MAEQARRRLARMFEDNAQLLRGFFVRRGARQDAEDLVQETYLRLLRAHQGNGEPIANPEAYLFTVAQNLAREQASRRHWSTLPIEEIEDLGQSLASGECVEDAAEREQRHQHLRTLLATLPEHTRAVLVMQYRDGLSYKEIAERMGVSPHMVKKHVVRGLSVCRRAMAEPSGRA
ncbi:sigma-70 family RNA polymerase sigma factor [Stenotrophomonas sp. G106K1]|uniref:RNA polymerase sigma factor n=1 Tax=Stenotrophomonas sp. G106K1 TaxID=3134792 RepID=UPI0030F39ADB